MEPNAETTREAWRFYVETGQLRPELLREHVHRAWARCHAAGVSPLAMEPRRLSPRETDELLERNRRLIDAAHPYLCALSRAVGAERHGITLADENGALLDVVGDEETVPRAERSSRAGMLLAEEAAGANGIGTALAEGAYVEIVGPEHFIEGWHAFTCQGLPVRGPRGRVAGAISTSVRRVEVAERVHEILLCAARGIEAELSSAALEEDVRRAARSGPDAAATLEKLRQDLVQIQSAARIRLDVAARAASRARPAAVVDPVRMANELIQRFQRRARLWRDIASDETGPSGPVDLQARLDEMACLLRTEMAVRRVGVSVRPGPPVLVVADVRDLSRWLFRAFLRALAAVAPGASADASVSLDPRAGTATWAFSVDTGPPPAYPLAGPGDPTGTR